MTRRTPALLAFLAAAALSSGCGPASPEDRFVADVRDTPGLQTQASDGQLLLIGRDACLKIGNSGQTRERVVAAVSAAAADLRAPSVSELDSRAIVDAAYAHLCPTKTFDASTPEQRFIADIDDTPGLSRTQADSELITLGRMICDAIGTPGITRANYEQAIGSTKYGPAVAKVILDAAELNLCPGKAYSEAPPVDVGPIIAGQGAPTTPAAPATPNVPAAPTGQLTAFSDGTWEVGVDVAAGKYKTAGTGQCYWARLAADGVDIIDNHIGAGPQTVTIKAGELFESQRCGTWAKAG